MSEQPQHADKCSVCGQLYPVGDTPIRDPAAFVAAAEQIRDDLEYLASLPVSGMVSLEVQEKSSEIAAKAVSDIAAFDAARGKDNEKE